MRRLLPILPALALALALAGSARAQDSDQKIEALRKFVELSTTGGDLPAAIKTAQDRTKYKNDLTQAAAKLDSREELFRGLVEPKWIDVAPEITRLPVTGRKEGEAAWKELEKIQADVYASLADRLEKRLTGELGGASTTQARVAALLLLDLSDPKSLRNEQNLFLSDRARATAGRMVTRLPALLDSNDEVVNQTVATVLARAHTVWGEEKVNAALQTLLLRKSESIRLHTARAIGAGLTALLLARAEFSNPIPEDIFLGSTASILPVLGKGASDESIAVRRAIFRNIQMLSEGLAADTTGPAPLPGAETTVRPSRMHDNTKLRNALAVQVSNGTLARGLGDSDVAVRWLARLVFEDLARSSQAAEVKPESDALLKALIEALPALERGLSDDNIRSRLSGVEALGALRERARPAAPALVARVRDSDRFVRWAAARALGSLGGEPPAGAVEALAWLLTDPDPSLRIEAAMTLEKYGPKAEAAAPALARNLNFGDVDARLQQLKALAKIGEKAAPVIPDIEKALDLTEPSASERFGTLPAHVTQPKPSSVKVRQEAVRTLGTFGVKAKSSLEKALEDPEPDVRRAAAEVLRNLPQPK